MENERISSKSKTTTFLLAFFLGAIGVHRFYVGKVGTGILQLILMCSLIGMPLVGVWLLIDWIQILQGNFTDSENLKIK